MCCILETNTSLGLLHYWQILYRLSRQGNSISYFNLKKIEKNHPSDHKGVNAKEHLWLGRADGPGPVWSGVGGWRRCPVWDWVSQGGGCGMDQTCSGGCSRLWRWRWQRGDPRESGRRKTPETLGGLWASALCGGPGGTVLGGRVPAGVRASRAVGSCFWRCSVFGPGLGPSGRPALRTPGSVFRLPGWAAELRQPRGLPATAGLPSLQAAAQRPHRHFCCDGLEHGMETSSQGKCGPLGALRTHIWGSFGGRIERREVGGSPRCPPGAVWPLSSTRLWKGSRLCNLPQRLKPVQSAGRDVLS